MTEQHDGPRTPHDLGGRRRAWAWPGSWPQLSELIARVLAVAARALYRGEIRRGLSSFLDRHRDVTRPEFRLARGGRGLDGLRIAFLSDVHAGSYLDEQDFTRVCARVANESPDLVCLGGDLVNLWEHEILHLRKGLSLLQPPLGIFAIYGNHEYDASREPRLWRSVLEEQGVELLVNRGRRLTRGGATLWLAGVDDLLHGKPDLEAALDGCAPDEPIVLLAHHPDFFEEAADVGMFEAIARGRFAGVKRAEMGGKGLGGVVEKGEGYFNPFLEILEEATGVVLPDGRREAAKGAAR